MNSEWRLSAQAEKQLYQACITSVSDYEAEIWWKNQKTYENQLQRLQNKALYKILEAFKTLSEAAMKLEANIESVRVRLNKKCRKYALRVITLSENHSIRQRTLLSFSSENEIEQKIPIELNYLNWNQNFRTQKHSTQLIKMLNTISTLISNEVNILVQSENSASWEKSVLEVTKVDITKEENRENIVKRHFTQIRQLMKQKIPIFYTDESKIKLTSQSEQFRLSADIYCIYDSNTVTESHYLDHTQDIIDAELYAISQVIKWIKESNLTVRHYWIFTDSQAAIQKMQKSNTAMYDTILQDLKSIKSENKTVHINWILSHTQISENKLAD